MKLALVVEHYDPANGGSGGEHLAGWVAREMVRRGHEVHVVCHDVAARVSRYRQAMQRASFDAHRSRRAHLPAAPAPAGAEMIHVHRLGGMRLHSALGFRLFGRRARAWCRCRKASGGIEVVHSFTVACPGDIYHAEAGVFAAQQAQAAAMRGTAGSAWKRLVQRLPGKQRTLLALERRALRRAGRTISLCRMMTEQLAAYYTGTGRVVTLATPRLETDAERGGPGDTQTRGRGEADREAEDRAWFRGHYKLAATDHVALFVGHDFRRKGLRYAIEAIARTRDWKLIVAGLGKVREYVELAGSLGLLPATDGAVQGGVEAPPARVLFVGPTREVAALYAAADALLLPAFYEPSGVVVLEALAHGLPVVGTGFLGLADLVQAHHAGIIVEHPRDIDALAAGLEALPAAGSTDRHALAHRARAAAASLSAEAFADRLEGLYREVAREKGR